MELLQRRQAVAVGHADVQQDNVRLHLLGQPQGIFPAVRLADNLDVRARQQAGQARANDLVVVANQNSNTHRASPKSWYVDNPPDGRK